MGIRAPRSSRQYPQLSHRPTISSALIYGERFERTSTRPNSCLIFANAALTDSSDETSHPRPMAWISPSLASPCMTVPKSVDILASGQLLTEPVDKVLCGSIRFLLLQIDKNDLIRTTVGGQEFFRGVRTYLTSPQMSVPSCYRDHVQRQSRHTPDNISQETRTKVWSRTLPSMDNVAKVLLL